MSNTLPMTMGLESLEKAVEAIKALQKAEKDLPWGTFEFNPEVTIWIDGCVIGKVRRVDDFFMFVPSAAWFGGVVEVMEDE